MERSTKAALERRLAGFVATCGVLLAANYLLPYAGLRDDSCQTMFSELQWSREGNNHAFMPQHMIGDSWDFFYDVHLEWEDDPAVFRQEAPEEEARHEALRAWMHRPERRHNRDALRLVVDRLCRDGRRFSLRFRSAHDGPVVAPDEVCADPSLRRVRWWIPVRRFETDEPLPPWMRP